MCYADHAMKREEGHQTVRIHMAHGLRSLKEILGVIIGQTGNACIGMDVSKQGNERRAANQQLSKNVHGCVCVHDEQQSVYAWMCVCMYRSHQNTNTKESQVVSAFNESCITWLVAYGRECVLLRMTQFFLSMQSGSVTSKHLSSG